MKNISFATLGLITFVTLSPVAQARWNCEKPQSQSGATVYKCIDVGHKTKNFEFKKRAQCVSHCDPVNGKQANAVVKTTKAKGQGFWYRITHLFSK